jgi:hypothetical protein
MAAPAAIAPSVEDAITLLDGKLDLSNVKMKLSDSDEGPSYDAGRLAVMEQEYRRFLALHLAYPGMDVVPCKIVDEIWHQHILDTAAYRNDCDAIFGFFLDHFPYFGMRGEEDAAALNDAYAETIQRYREAFGEPPAGTWIAVDASSRCKRTACKPQKCK